MLPSLYATCIVVAILLFSSTISTATGFGAAVLAIPLCSFVIDIKIAIPLLALVSVSNSLVMSLREYRNVGWKEFRTILIWAGITYPVGNLAYHALPITALKYWLGLFVISLALEGLWTVYQQRPQTRWNPKTGRAFLLIGGLVQGALACGGPLIVAYAHAALPDKGKFRATVFNVWVVMNGVFILIYFAGPHSNLAVLKLGLCAVPAIAGGIWLGQKLHDRASDRFFRLLVCSTLLLSGISLMLK